MGLILLRCQYDISPNMPVRNTVNILLNYLRELLCGAHQIRNSKNVIFLKFDFIFVIILNTN